jgi:hypothetical protein
MSPPDLLPLRPAVVVIELVGSVLLAGYAVAALACLGRGRGVRAARLLVAEGAVLALSFKVAGALLKTVELHSWQQIGMFSAVLALRVLLKRLFAWEGQRLQDGGGRENRPGAPA